MKKKKIPQYAVSTEPIPWGKVEYLKMYTTTDGDYKQSGVQRILQEGDVIIARQIRETFQFLPFRFNENIIHPYPFDSAAVAGFKIKKLHK